jgi:hypothetical protein
LAICLEEPFTMTTPMTSSSTTSIPAAKFAIERDPDFGLKMADET